MKKILIVEDEDHIVAVLKLFLEKEGFEVLVALDGVEAISLAQEHLPDLVFLDIVIPKMNGYLVCQALREEPETKHIPIVFVSARAQEEDIKKGLNMGGQDYIVKPFTPNQIRSVVDKYVRGLEF